MVSFPVFWGISSSPGIRFPFVSFKSDKGCSSIMNFCLRAGVGRGGQACASRPERIPHPRGTKFPAVSFSDIIKENFRDNFTALLIF